MDEAYRRYYDQPADSPLFKKGKAVHKTEAGRTGTKSFYGSTKRPDAAEAEGKPAVQRRENQNVEGQKTDSHTLNREELKSMMLYVAEKIVENERI